MKKLLLGIVLLSLVLAFHSHAYADNTCSKFGELAGVIMMLRQQNTPMDEVVKIGSEVTQTGEQQSALEVMIIDAYTRPLMSSDRYQKRIINEFRNEWMVNCYKLKNEG